MVVRVPTLEQINDLGSDFGLVLTADEAASFQQAFKGPLASYGRLEELVPPALSPIAPRSPGYRPPSSENPYGAWYWKTNIRSGSEGLLSGKAVAIKDNICVAGVPMMNGSALLEGYVPEIDATVVTRILDAGGTIAGKAACEDLCFSGASHTIRRTRPAAPPAEVRRWWRLARCRWRSAVTRVDRSVHPRAGAASTD
jgi:amidase